ncbi:MAG: IS4 family transposase [Candidatus Saccharibacteria bacterium]
MTASNKNNISASNLLLLIPGQALNRIAQQTHVNHYIKVLDGESVFCLLLYALVECQRNSLRTMQDIFNSASFKFLFNLPWGKRVRYNSISERLSVINPEFFKQAYELIHSVFSTYYSDQEMEQRLLIRVDSTMVAEAANKLKQGIEVGPKPTRSKATYRKQIKYTFAFDGHLPCAGQVFTHKTYTSECKAVPEVIYRYTQKNQGAVFVFDRGMHSRQVMDQLTERETPFVTRIKSNSRYTVARVIEKGDGRKVGILTLESDMEVRLPYRKSFLKNNYRLIIARNPQTGSVYYFLTNIFDLEADRIIEYYKKRWDIEVFFRFLKQELNLSHITSTSENGMQVMLYMTMICSMLVLVYKRVNQVGYKTAVRRTAFELNEYIIKLIVLYCGGDPSLVFR